MAWKIRFERRAEKELSKLGKTAQKRILDFLEHKIAKADNPRQYGAALGGPLSGYWKYRIGDYRVICNIQDKEITVMVLAVGHRKDVYKR